MLFPVGTDRGFRRTPVVTTAIIALTVAVFFLQMLAANRAAQEAGGEDLVVMSAERSELVQRLAAGPGQPWYTAVTSAFLHADWLHIVGNMVLLAVFGVLIEDRLGHLGFAVLYLSGAAASSVLFQVLQGGYGFGASGAVATVTGAFLALMPLVQVRVASLVGGSLVISGWGFVLIAVGFDVFLSLRLTEHRVGWGAHLGGYAFGFSVAMVLLATGVLGPERHDMFALFKRARLRRELRTAGAMEGASVRARADAGADEASRDLMQRRAAITERMGAGDLAGAAALYAAMVKAHAEGAGGAGTTSAASVLSRRHQIDLATHLHQAGDRKLAALAYERFASTYRDERDAPRAALLAAMLCARSLGETARARSLLAGLRERLRDEGERSLCAELEREVTGVPGVADLEVKCETKAAS